MHTREVTNRSSTKTMGSRKCNTATQSKLQGRKWTTMWNTIEPSSKINKGASSNILALVPMNLFIEREQRPKESELDFRNLVKWLSLLNSVDWKLDYYLYD